MKRVYGVTAFLIALGVIVQAMSLVWGVAGLEKYIGDGGVLDKAAVESEDKLFPEIVGLMIHGMNGTMIIPALALLLLIFSFFAKVDGGVKMAIIVLVLVAVQVTLGLAGHSIPALGALHGLNAFLLLGAAIHAGMRSRRTVAAAASEEPEPLPANA
jgi:hypothetical protein